MTTYNYISSNKRKSAILIALFIIFIGFLGWVFGELTDYGYGGLVFAIIIAVIMSLFGYYSGDKLALWTVGAKGPIKKEDNPYLWRLVENLCITAGLALPKIYIISDPGLNALATGRNPQNASIAVTSGLIENLANEELEGVLAHELSHIKNYDVRLMTLVVILVGIISLLSNWFFRVSFFGGRRRDSRGGGQLTAILMLLGLILLILSPIIANLIKLAVSRKREFLADASGALLTRYPEGLASALEKISRHSQPLIRANTATSHLYISNPFGGAAKGLTKLFSTHPPVADRIKALREMGNIK